MNSPTAAPAKPDKESGTAPAPTDAVPSQNSGVEAQNIASETSVVSDPAKVNNPVRKLSNLEILRNAQRELMSKMTGSRLHLLGVQAELDEFKVEDDYETCVLDVVRAYGPAGIAGTQLHIAFSDGSKLTKARKKLEERKLITVTKEHQSFRLKATEESSDVVENLPS